MKILILGYSDLVKRKILPVLKNKKNNLKFSVCSVSQNKKNVGELFWYKNYNEALKKSDAKIVYISLINSYHYYWAKKFLNKNYHVIVDKPLTLNFKQANELVNIAKKKKKLLSEAIVFNYHKQITKALEEIKSLKQLTKVVARFTIPTLPKNNFRNYKKLGGGCMLDMGPYAAAVFRIFFNNNYKSLNINNCSKKNKKGLSNSFTILVSNTNKSFSGKFSFNGKYENNLTLFTKQKKVLINRAFSPPNNENLILQINDGRGKKEKKIKKDDAFLNYFKFIFKTIKTKKFEKSYQNILKDSYFREKLEKI